MALSDWIRCSIASVLGLGIAALAIIAQAPVTPATYKPTEVQSLRLQVKQRDAVIAQKDWQVAQEHYQAAVAALNQEGEAVRKENKWPDSVKFDANTLEFAPVAAPAPAPTQPTGGAK